MRQSAYIRPAHLLHWLVITALLLSLPRIGNALDLSTINPLKQSFTITVTNKDHKLKKALEDELSEQRKLNRQLKFYKTPFKIAQYEKQLIDKRLRAEGYYGATIKSQGSEQGTEHIITPGPLYQIQTVNWHIPKGAEQYFTNIIKANTSLRAQMVLDLQKKITRYIESEYCYYRVKVNYEATIYHADQSAELTWTIEPSEQTSFASVSFRGLDTIDHTYLKQRVGIQPGDCFRTASLNQARLALYKTNLISSVEVSDDGIKADGVDITFLIRERKHRSLSFGVGFRSEEGVGVSNGWQHRNLWGKAQQANLDLYLSSPRKTVTGELVIPHYKKDEQTLTFFTELTEEDTEAFESLVLSGGVSLSRPITRKIRGEVGIQVDFSQVEEDGTIEEYALPSIPIQFEYDSRNAPLDPKKGWVGSIGLQPFWNLYEQNTRFIKTNLAASLYKTFDSIYGKPTIAVRAAAGSLFGANRIEVPANERFYVGGGGSVRGYSFQTLGPLTDGEPDGGLSFTEYSIESRLHWGQQWGAALFLDGGAAYRERLPSVDEKLFWGAGIGLRYYTSFAPIRFDIAVPLDRRDGIDDAFQVYISIGQAF